MSLIVLSLLAGCQSPRQVPETLTDLPAQFSQYPVDTDPVINSWLQTFASADLDETVRIALEQNYVLAQQRAELAISEQQLKIARSLRLPDLQLVFTGQRQRPFLDARTETRFDINASVNFDLDVWGQLADNQRRAALLLAGERMAYLDAERRLATQTASALFNAISADQLQRLFNSRLNILNQSLDVIQQGYRSGLNEALDVYLAQNTVEQERANVATQQQAIFSTRTALELLLAEYPGANLAIPHDLPTPAPLTGVGIPADLLQRRADIQAAWLALLAADAELAIAQKDLLPGLSFTANLRDQDNAIRRLLDGGEPAWTAAASLFQPIFQGGRLRAQREQALLRVSQAEQRYLQVTFAALAEVENELNNARSLDLRFAALTRAEANAAAALTLANDQYLRGLVDYTTVLESQRRAFDAQTALVQLRNQLLQSRLALLLALGGGY
ncbi:MAG: efflux transporter outer membrane subunit [Pseudomonadota bacterium]